MDRAVIPESLMRKYQTYRLWLDGVDREIVFQARKRENIQRELDAIVAQIIELNPRLVARVEALRGFLDGLDGLHLELKH